MEKVNEFVAEVNEMIVCGAGKIEYDPGSYHTNDPAEYSCPRCRRIIDNFGQKYCDKCGMKLDWSDESRDKRTDY